MISVIILAVVFVLITVRQIGSVRLQIWHIMAGGAVAVLAFGEITAAEALKSVNLDVMGFLLGMFIVGQALEESGYLAHLAYRLFRRARSLDGLVLAILFGMGLLSAVLMNDTLAIVGTPVVLMLARKNNTSAKILLLALAFGVTIGSVMSPIGNPQNLLIASQGNLSNPFITFFKYLFIPTLINLGAAYALLRLFFRRHFNTRPLNHSPELILDQRLARLCRISLAVMALMILVKIGCVFLLPAFDFRLTYIALTAALPVVTFHKSRINLLSRIDWPTLVFFGTMFILMQSVWQAQFFQEILSDTGLNPVEPATIMGISVLLSQFISNVPMVALYLPVLAQPVPDTVSLMALAAGSTIAGNLTIIGAASNIIIIQNAEIKAGQTLGFRDFTRIGLPLTVINILVYWLFLQLF
ncbi:MAG: anion transporter [Dehalococcoidaceae bacterium]|nr:anion transporter [Dehalococcoidaceae bacterium]